MILLLLSWRNYSWEMGFFGVDFDGNFGGLITGLSSNCNLLNCFSIDSRLCIEVFNKDLDRNITILISMIHIRARRLIELYCLT
jgi:hypothetical protein